MQGFQRPHLVLGNPFRPFEIVSLNIGVLRPRGRLATPAKYLWRRPPLVTCPLSTAASRASTSDCSSTSAKAHGLLADTIVSLSDDGDGLL
jgi:hypothetical protein